MSGPPDEGGSVLQKNAVTVWGAAALMTMVGLSGCTIGGGDGMTLTLGTMMPLTGALNNLGPDMQNGAKLAIKHVNDANMGLTIRAYHEDDKTTDTSAAPSTFNLLVSRGATGIAGPCCSGVTESVLDLAVQNQVVVASPSATSPALTDRDNQGYFWRVVPSDAVQGKVLAQLVSEDDVETVAVILVNNAYGNGLARVFKETFTTTLGGVVVKEEKYDEGATVFSSQVDAVCASPRPDAVVLVAYVDDGAAILKEMQAKGCRSGVAIYGSEGVYDAGFIEKAGQDTQGNWIAAGAKGTAPESGDLDAFNQMFEAEYGHAPSLYAAESYDAVMYIALAALAAGSTEGKDIKDKLLEIANSPGEKVSQFQEAAQMIQDGKDIDWVGQSHDFSFGPKHEPTTGVYSWWQVTESGSMSVIATGKSA